jgi:hypothetical protein
MVNDQLIVFDASNFNPENLFKKVKAAFEQQQLEYFCIIVNDAKLNLFKLVKI